MTMMQRFASTGDPAEQVPQQVWRPVESFAVAQAPDPLAIDEPTGRLMLLLGELDKVGLAGELAEARALLGKAWDVARVHADVLAAHRATRDQLVAAVVDGSVGMADAARQLAAADSRGAAGDLMQAAVATARREAVAAARADAVAVHDALAGRVRTAVDVAVAAGRQLVDVKAVAAALKPPRWREAGQPYRPGDQHPWIDNPPVLPVVTLDTLSGDPVKVNAWAASGAAVQEIGRLLEVATVLHALWGNSSHLYPADVDHNQAYLVGTLAEPVQLAVADALGWKLGLHLSLRTARPEAPRSLTDTIIAGIRYPLGWVGVGNVSPKGGPYGGGARPRS